MAKKRAKYSKSHERDENSRMWKGFRHSTLGVLLCWVPVLGVILSTSGFARQIVRFTQKHRLKMAVFLLYGLVSLVIAVSAFTTTAYSYSRNPDLFRGWMDKGYRVVTGQVPPEVEFAELHGYVNQLTSHIGPLPSFDELRNFDYKSIDWSRFDPRNVDWTQFDPRNVDWSRFDPRKVDWSRFFPANNGAAPSAIDPFATGTDYTGVAAPGLGVFDDASMLSPEGSYIPDDNDLIAEDDDLMPAGMEFEHGLLDDEDLFANAALDDSSIPNDMGDAAVPDYQMNDEVDADDMDNPFGDDDLEIDDSDLIESDDDDLFGDEDEGVDFGYEVTDERATDDDKHIEYRVIIDKFDPTNEDLTNLFHELVAFDSFELHTVLVYRAGDDQEGGFTVAKLEQLDPGADPTIERR